MPTIYTCSWPLTSNILSSIGELFFPAAAHAKVVSDSVKITMIIAFVIIAIAILKYGPTGLLILAPIGVIGIGGLMIGDE